MKKNTITTIIAIIFTIFLYSVSYGQLNGTVIPKSEKIIEISYKNGWLYKTVLGYEVWYVTDNEFDDTFNIIRLGKTKEESLKTLNDLLDICVNELTVVTKQGTKELILFGSDAYSGSFVRFKTNNTIGYSAISQKQIKDLIKYFEELE